MHMCLIPVPLHVRNELRPAANKHRGLEASWFVGFWFLFFWVCFCFISFAYRSVTFWRERTRGILDSIHYKELHISRLLIFHLASLAKRPWYLFPSCWGSKEDVSGESLSQQTPLLQKTYNFLGPSALLDGSYSSPFPPLSDHYTNLKNEN